MDENSGGDIKTRSCPGYGVGPPWLFHGSAIYQLHLVKADNARAFIPKELKLVEAFGYTLGGFFLADYDDSPAGKFDELVVIPGIVWNPPTSCAWAARVLVNSQEACKHGRKEVGLPSRIAMFSKKLVGHIEKPGAKSNNFLDMVGIGSSFHGSREHIEIQVSEVNDKTSATLCNITLPCSESMSSKKWEGPKIKMSLPSFSGRTTHNPNLLKYSCQIECRVQRVKPAKILGRSKNGGGDGNHNNLIYDLDDVNGFSVDSDMWDRCIRVLLSKPILALKFNSLKMQVQAPSIVTYQSRDNDPKIRAA